MMRAGLILLCSLALAGIATAQSVPSETTPMVGGGGAIPMRATRLPASASQGVMVIGNTHPAAVVEYAGRTLRVTSYGTFVFGIGRDATGDVVLRIKQPATEWTEQRIAITPRDWPIENINGVPPSTVNPPKAVAERIEREQARVVAVRTRDDARTGFTQVFTWPVQGRISGRFGNQRVYNGTPKSPHSGMDIAVATGTPVKAPTDGVITFADPGLYLTGGTVVLDHGHGISSNFLHLSRIDAKVGDIVKQGDVIGAVGATGRATGPHLHWGMNWFDTRIDPLLVLERK